MFRPLVAALMLIPALALARPQGGGQAADPEIQKLQREIAAAKLDKTLELSRDQARALLPILDKADALRNELKAEREKNKPAVKAALNKIRDDIKRDGVASAESKKALREARGQGFRKYRGELKVLGEQVRELLTDEQKAKLADFSTSEGGKGKGKRMGKRGGEGGKKMDGKKRGSGRVLNHVVLSPEFRELVRERAR